MAWELLFGSASGLMSLGVSVGVLVIGTVMGRAYRCKVQEDAQEQPGESTKLR